MEVNLPGGLGLRVSRKGVLPRVQIEKPKEYKSPHNSLKGKFLKPVDLDYYSEFGVPTSLENGKVALEVDFTPGGSTQPETLGDVRRAFQIGGEDYPHFLKSLARKKFEKVSLIVGRTNPRMARYAVEKLGYHYARLPEDPVRREQVLNDPESKITVFITKEEVLKIDNKAA